MADSRCTWYEVVQFLIIAFTIFLMLSKYYPFFKNIFSFFYESEFSIICVVVGCFSILHAIYMTFRASKGEVKWREVGEAGTVIMCGSFLLSPMFNTIFELKFLSFVTLIPDDIIRYFAFGLIPISIFYLIDMMRYNKTD